MKQQELKLCDRTRGFALIASIALSACAGGRIGGAASGGGGVDAGSLPPRVDAGPVLTGDTPWPVWTGENITTPPSATGKTYYVDGANGSDSNNGTSEATAFKTIKKTLPLVAAGDTVLIKAGLYREGIDLSNSAPGTDGKPITFGSFGDGPVILDGSIAVTGWTQVNGTVWKAPISFTPIAVVVNETPLKQITQGQGGSSAPTVDVSTIVPGSGKWGFQGGEIYADLGAGDPATLDIVVPKDQGDQQHVFFFGDWYTFSGLTVRGSGAAGIWGYGSHVTIEHCDIKFNGKQGVNFLVNEGTAGTTDDSVLYSHIYFNVLVNWPRGNNGYAESGGGWPGALSFSFILRPIARGNVVHMNGGEGVLSYGTEAGKPSGSALFEQNLIFDNWSVNLYFDNQPNDVARQNIIYNHPPDKSNYLYDGPNEPWSVLDKYTVGIMLADEENSSDATNNYANLDHTQVYDNLIAGCRISIRDYAEGEAHTIANHGLKNALIANNTIIMSQATLQNTDTMGIFLQDNKTPSGTQRNVNSRIENNLIIGFRSDPLLWTDITGTLEGVNVDYNLYFSTNAKPFRVASTDKDFAGWKTGSGADAHGVNADPQIVNAQGFQAAGEVYDWKDAKLGTSSPALNAGNPQEAFNFDITNQDRAGWNIGAF